MHSYYNTLIINNSTYFMLTSIEKLLKCCYNHKYTEIIIVLIIFVFSKYVEII